MKARTSAPFTRVAALLLALLAVAQLVRFLAGWPVTINGFAVPVWLSALLALVVGLLAMLLWRESRRG